MAEPAAPWSPVPDWTTAVLERDGWSARVLPGLGQTMVSGDIERATSELAPQSAECGLWGLFDEPTSALDPELVGEVLEVIRQLAEEGRSMMLVTHEIRFAGNVADRVIFMDHGSVVEEGPAEQVLQNPRHERTRRFLGELLGH